MESGGDMGRTSLIFSFIFVVDILACGMHFKTVLEKGAGLGIFYAFEVSLCSIELTSLTRIPAESTLKPIKHIN